MTAFLSTLVLFTSLSLSVAPKTHALSLRDFLKKKSPLRASVKLAYLRELQSFQSDAVYCSKDDSYPNMFQSCRDAVRDEQGRLLQPDWGSDWTLEASHWVPTFGEVLTFRKLNIMRRDASMSCDASLSIPANKPQSKRFSFDIYCDH